MALIICIFLRGDETAMLIDNGLGIAYLASFAGKSTISTWGRVSVACNPENL